MAFILDGIAVSERIKEQLLHLKDSSGRADSPCLAVIRSGSSRDDISYQKSAEKRCGEFGIRFLLAEMEQGGKAGAFIEQFDRMNNDERVDGILIMGDYPDEAAKEYVQRNMIPRKDVDGVGYENIAKLCSHDRSAVLPCTVEAVLSLLDFYKIELKGKKVCVLGRSLVTGKPLALSLLNRDATVTVCHSGTVDIAAQARQADIIVSAVGIPRFVNRDFVTENSIVVDVGINVDENKKICGDADYAALRGFVKAITPVPKGIGSITNMILVSHVYHSCLARLPEAGS